MSSDPLSPRGLAAALALAGLAALMLQPIPDWPSVGFALACIGGFGLLRLFAGPAPRRAPVRPRRVVAEAVPAMEAAALPALPPPSPEAHRAILATVRDRRATRGG